METYKPYYVKNREVEVMVAPTVNINGEVFTIDAIQNAYLVIKYLNITDATRCKVLEQLKLEMVRAREIDLFED